MNRERALDAVHAENRPFDLLVIGGGATGLGVAVDAANRGYRTVLVERGDFGCGTSSRSTKLIHGGVRYLRQGRIHLVRESLRERGLLIRNAPHCVRQRAFIIPIYRRWEGPFYGCGLRLYERMAGSLSLGPTARLSREETLSALPNVEPGGLRSGVRYLDGQFDDARLAVDLAATIFEQGGLALNYAAAVALLKQGGRVAGAVVEDRESGSRFVIKARMVINATGVFSDGVRRLDDPAATARVLASQGAHLVLPRAFLPGDSALMVPRTPDGRVLFAVPWEERVVVGTTDVAVEQISEEPRPLEQEIEFLLSCAGRYLARAPGPADVLSIFAGLRPLVKRGSARNTAALSRDHALFVSSSGLLTVTGGKWTTYRRMAQAVVDRAEREAGWAHRPCQTETLPVRHVCEAVDKSREPWHPALPAVTEAAVVHAVRHEMARTVEDVLARRTRALLQDAQASAKLAPRAASILALELGRASGWEQQQGHSFRQLAASYCLPE